MTGAVETDNKLKIAFDERQELKKKQKMYEQQQNWKEYRKITGLLMEKEKEYLNSTNQEDKTKGYLLNKITTALNIGATYEDTIENDIKNTMKEFNDVGSKKQIGNELQQYNNSNNLGDNNNEIASFDNAHTGDNVELPAILKVLLAPLLALLKLLGIKLFRDKDDIKTAKVDETKPINYISVTGDLHSMGVKVDNINKTIALYDPNGEFRMDKCATNEEKLKKIFGDDYYKIQDYKIVMANEENKNKGTFTGMCGVLTSDWFEQDMKQVLKDNKLKLNSQEEMEHYRQVNRNNNPDVDRMMAHNQKMNMKKNDVHLGIFDDFIENNNNQPQQVQQTHNMQIGNIGDTQEGFHMTTRREGGKVIKEIYSGTYC